VGGASVFSSPAFTNTGDDARVPEGYLRYQALKSDGIKYIFFFFVIFSKQANILIISSQVGAVGC
jgi:hypothetical protein